MGRGWPLLHRSQNWLAREIGISPGYLSTLVNGGRAPSGRIRRRMQEALNVTEFEGNCSCWSKWIEAPAARLPVFPALRMASLSTAVPCPTAVACFRTTSSSASFA